MTTTISGFDGRMAQAVEFERAVRAALTERGWHTEPFGQAQLSPATRDALRQVQPDTLVRWMPDIVASRRFAARTVVIFVDAKAGTRWRDTGRHDFESRAVEAAGRWAEFSNCPTYFICADWTVYTPDQVAATGTPGQWRGSGSGTPFLLVSTSSGVPFDRLFPMLDGAA